MFDEEFLTTTLTPLLAIAGAMLGLIGTALGILNLLLNRKPHRFDVDVKVSGGKRFGVENAIGRHVLECDEMHLTFTVTNHSYFPITVARLGVALRHGFWGRSLIDLPFSPEGDTRIEPRSAAKFVAGASCNDKLTCTSLFALCRKSRKASLAVRSAFVTLATGQTFHGDGNGAARVLANIEDWAVPHFDKLAQLKATEDEDRESRRETLDELLKPAPERHPRDAGKG